ncbi:MAG: prepilin peptidase [Butyrivibrio sp.]|nr:prepilin peptidase [Butyrivibrio sp.]
MIFGMIVLSVLGIISFRDIKEKEIPVWLILCCGALSLGRVIFLLTKGTLEPAELLISLVPGALLLLAGYVTRGGVGYGDGLLALSIGPAVGAAALATGMCIAVMGSGLFSGVLLILRKAGRKTRIPFVPFMALGVGVMLFA